ncbi:SOS response-associated peptidase [Algiphilus aromaticivorans]|uniref:SOS response-associated peptidase n=1 Tax=Algiphilus aromaticivorans TaxID=382454 RepID=UPI000694AE59|nr:SOS response-associated peptidase [Algiphilus aromaticivorans]
MCGRFVSPEEAAIERAVEVGRKRGLLWKPSFNTAPTMAVPVLLGDSEPGYTLDTARWGFIPHWWKKDEEPRSTINARVESAADKPMWRDAFAKRRCLIPALGWYEWAQREHIDTETGEVQTIKQPHFLHAPDKGLLLFAGLYSECADARTGASLTVAIITGAAKGPAAEVHDRMPVILKGDAAIRWADPEQHDKAALSKLLERNRLDAIAAHPVSRRVNSPSNDDTGLVEAFGANSP